MREAIKPQSVAIICNPLQSACNEGGTQAAIGRNQHALTGIIEWRTMPVAAWAHPMREAIRMQSACNPHAISRGVPCQSQPGRIRFSSSRAPPSHVPVGKGWGAVMSTCMLSRTTSARTAPAPMREAISTQSACTQRAYCSCSACDGNERPVEGEGGSERRGEHMHAPRSGPQRSSEVIRGH